MVDGHDRNRLARGLLMLGIGVGLGATTGRTIALQSESSTLFAAMSSQPNATRKGHINTLIAALKTAGVWSKLDLLYVIAAHDAQAAALNWTTPASYALTAVNGPTFLADRHYVGDGVSMHLTTGFTPSTHAVAASIDGTSFGAWVRNDVTSTTQFEIGCISGSLAYLNTRSTGNVVARVNSSANTNQALSVATSVGFTAVNRADGSNVSFYKDGGALGSPAEASVTFQNTALALLRNSTSYSTRQVAAAYYGGSLTAGEHAALYAALSAYMTAVGA